jgi:DNA repair photolyase
MERLPPSNDGDEEMKTTIDMAREAGFTEGELAFMGDNFRRFADLARADEREQGQRWFDAVTAQHKQLILAEREACAKVCEDNSASYSERASRPEKVRDINPEVARVAVQTCGHVAAAIRARGNT